jgi:hypothetical protein
MCFPNLAKTGSDNRRSVSYPLPTPIFWGRAAAAAFMARRRWVQYTIPLAHPGAAALNKDYQYDCEKHAGNYPDDRGAVHVDSSFLRQFDKNCWNCSIIVITAGPRTTRNRAGKMKNTSGNTSLTEVFAAISSTC